MMSALGEERRVTLAEALSAIPDPRRAHLRVHSLVSILQVAVAAMLCGHKSVNAIAQWARERFEDDPKLLESLGVTPGRYPSMPTFHRVLRKVSAAVFETLLGRWLMGTGLPSNETIVLDGKTARGSRDKGVPGVLLASAYAVHAQAVIAQMRCPGPGTELATGKKVLAQVPIEGNLVTGDALYCDREVCELVHEGGGDYLFPAKGDQAALRDDIARAFSPSAPGRPEPY